VGKDRWNVKQYISVPTKRRTEVRKIAFLRWKEGRNEGRKGGREGREKTGKEGGKNEKEKRKRNSSANTKKVPGCASSQERRHRLAEVTKILWELASSSSVK
jgi:hypothetical protein